MSQTPTDPVKELIEAAHAFDEDCNRHGGVGMNKSVAAANAAVVAIPSLSAMVAREEAMRALIAELRKREVPEHNDYIDVSAEKSAYEWCADALAAILEGK